VTPRFGLPGAIGLLAAVLLGQATPVALAQTSSTLETPTPRRGRPLALAVSMLSGFESAAGEGGGAPAAPSRLRVALNYGKISRRNSLDLSMGSVVPYSEGMHKDLFSYAGAMHFSSRLGRRTWLEAAESISARPLDVTVISGYSPSLPGSPDAALGSLTTNASLTADREVRYDGRISLSRTLSPRSSAVFSFTHTGSTSEDLRTSASRLVSAKIDHRVSSSGVLHAGYGFGSASFASQGAGGGLRQDIDLGFDYTKPLSSQTALMAGASSTLLGDGQSTRFRLLPYATLSRGFGRSWSSRFGYSRPMQFVAGFQQPFLSDAVSVNVDGRLGRMWFLSVASGAARGSAGFDGSASTYDSYTTSARVYRQIGRAWRVEAEGFATQFRSGGSGPLDVVLPSRFTRRGVRAGVSWSSAMFRR
jgi:hypothetical protein